MLVIVLIAVILVIAGLFVISICPNMTRNDGIKVFEKQYIAHRGLFDNNTGAPENSIRAFEKAVNAGYGIELDVQLTADNRLVVFHDESLYRMCKVKKNLWECTFEELQRCCLQESDEKVPLFEDVLRLVNGKVPLIVEIKQEGRWKDTTKRTAEMLDKYNGSFCVESFHPLIVKWFKDNRPDVIRGQLSTNYFGDKIKQKWYTKFLLTNMMLNFLTKPDFIAYSYKWKSNIALKICRKISPAGMVVWTIKNQADLENAKQVFDVIIFDSFIPK